MTVHGRAARTSDRRRSGLQRWLLLPLLLAGLVTFHVLSDHQSDAAQLVSASAAAAPESTAGTAGPADVAPTTSVLSADRVLLAQHDQHNQIGACDLFLNPSAGLLLLAAGWWLSMSIAGPRIGWGAGRNPCRAPPCFDRFRVALCVNRI